jgi:hypothetical protein
VANAKTCPPSWRAPLLMVGILLLIGLCTLGSGLADIHLRREAATVRSPLPEVIGVSEISAPPLAVRDRIQSDFTRHYGNSAAARPEASGVAAIGDDPRAYLSTTAALRRRHHEAKAAALDPYQVSLNSSVYLAAGAASPDGDSLLMHAAITEPCWFP